MILRLPAAALATCSGLLLLGCFGTPETPPPPGGDADPACQLNTPTEKTPGYPFSLQKFRADVVPVIVANCAGAGACHTASGTTQGKGGFSLWEDAATSDCNFNKTFNSAITKIDLTEPSASRLYAAVSPGAPHPFTFPSQDAPELAKILAFAEDAKATQAANGGGTTTPTPGASPYDYTVFQQKIIPDLMTAGCLASGCHLKPGIGLSIDPNAAPNSPDMEANFVNATARGDLENPAGAKLYFKGTNRHAQGTSTTFSAAQAAEVLAWIEDAKNSQGDTPPPGGVGCAPVENFNLGVFQNEIYPILNGTVDLNNAGNPGRSGGCANAVGCHGDENRGNGILILSDNRSALDNLKAFACFVNLDNPSASEALTCPLGQACRRSPHPGANFFFGADDLNYQKILGFLFGTKANVSPLDFAFFVRRINPMYDDINVTLDGQTTCAFNGCHAPLAGTNEASGGSDFPIISNAGDSTTLARNFVTTTGFTNFIRPDQGSLFIYPTDIVSQPPSADNPFTTGIPHPGGPIIQVGSQQANDILKFSAGLRPDGQGFLRDWLVTGDFTGVSLITDRTVINETAVQPKIFDRGGGNFLAGEWDGFFSDAQTVDLNIPFPRNNTARIAYASANIINTANREIRAQLLFNTDNPIQVYVNNQLVEQNDQGGDVTALITLKASSQREAPTRILVKLLQRANDANFEFSVQARDQFGNLLTDRTAELVNTLGPNGGI